MSVMWNPEEALHTAQPVADGAITEADRRLRAQVWGAMVAVNAVVWVIGLWLIGSAIF